MSRATRVPATAGRSSWAAALLFALSGCGLTTVEDAREEAHTVARDAAAARAGISAEPGYVTVRLLDRPWVGLEPIEEDKARLPERFVTQDAVTLPLAGAQDDALLAARIEAATGVPVRFVGDARDDAGTPFASSDLLVPNGAVWTGPLDRLLDAWAGAAGHEWHFNSDAGRIEIVRQRTAVFRVNALAGTERHGASSSTQDQAGEGGSSSLSAQSIESETVYDPWPEIEEQIAGLVGEETRVTVSPASASVTVSGAPADVRRVRGYLAWLNREVLRPVTLSVHLYAVRFERESDHGVDLSLSEMLDSSVGLAVAGDTVSVVRPSDAVSAGDTLAAAVRALSRAGTVSRVLSADIPSLNGKPAQFLELTKEAYLKELRTTAGEGVAQTELVPGTVSSGFALSYLARITGPDEVLVRLSASLRDRPRFGPTGWFVLSLGWVQESWPQALREACSDLDTPAGLPVNEKQTSTVMEAAVAQDPEATLRAAAGSHLRAPGSTGLAMAAGAPTVTAAELMRFLAVNDGHVLETAAGTRTVLVLGAERDELWRLDADGHVADTAALLPTADGGGIAVQWERLPRRQEYRLGDPLRRGR